MWLGRVGVDRIGASRFDDLLDFLLLVPQLSTVLDLGQELSNLVDIAPAP